MSYAQFEQQQQEKADALKKLLGANREVRKPEASIPKQYTKIEAAESDESDDDTDKKTKKAGQKKAPKEVSAEQLGFTSPPIDRDRRGGRGGRGGRGRGGRGSARGGNNNRGAATSARRGGNFDASGSSQKYNDLFPSLSGK